MAEPDEPVSTLAAALPGFDPWMREYENPDAETYCSVCGKVEKKASLDASLRCIKCQP